MNKRLAVCWVVPPGRLPTVIHDPGYWWDQLSNDPFISLNTLDANYAWWNSILGENPFTGAILMSPNDITPIAQFIDDRIETANSGNSSFRISIDRGPTATNCDYSSSVALEEFAHTQTDLHESIAPIVRVAEPADVFIFSVTGSRDLLSALICAAMLKKRFNEAYFLIADHGYENFSLMHSIANLEAKRAFLSIFDAVIVSKDEKNDVVLGVVAGLKNGCRSKGYLKHTGPLEHLLPSPDALLTSLPRVQTFCPTAILWTRMSPRKCYWDKCTFCVQNVKFDGNVPPSRSEVEAATMRLSRLAELGLDTFIFSDEALSPAFLSAAVGRFIELGSPFKWSCRCKIEATLDDHLIKRSAMAGCFEMLFGIESINSATLTSMKKFNPLVDEGRTSSILRSLSDAGIGVHINLIAGFPGESSADLQNTTRWVSRLAGDLRNATYLLNRFFVFPGTPIANDPTSYDLALSETTGDVIEQIPYSFVSAVGAREAVRIDTVYNTFKYSVDEAFGFLGLLGAGSSAYDLYVGSGIGADIKLHAPKRAVGATTECA